MELQYKFKYKNVDVYYFRYSTTLSMIIPAHIVRRQYLDITQGNKTTIPIWTIRCKPMSDKCATVYGLVAVSALELRDMLAGVYDVDVVDEGTVTFGDVELPAAFPLGPATNPRPYFDPKILPKARIKVLEVIDYPIQREYTAVNGKKYVQVLLPGVIVGYIEEGYHAGHRLAFVVPVKPGELPIVQPGDIIEDAVWIAYKAGRGDFYTSKTSHQVGIYLWGLEA